MNKLLLIAILIAAILIIGFILLVSLFSPKKVPEPVKPVIQASFSPSPTSPSNQAGLLRLVTIDPREDTNQSYFPIKQVFFSFSEPMNPATVIVESSPSAKIITSLEPGNPNTVVITPEKGWKPGITTIIISNTTTSANNKRLNQPIIYKINTQFPANPPGDAPGL